MADHTPSRTDKFMRGAGEVQDRNLWGPAKWIVQLVQYLIALMIVTIGEALKAIVTEMKAMKQTSQRKDNAIPLRDIRVEVPLKGLSPRPRNDHRVRYVEHSAVKTSGWRGTTYALRMASHSSRETQDGTPSKCRCSRVLRGRGDR